MVRLDQLRPPIIAEHRGGLGGVGVQKLEEPAKSPGRSKKAVRDDGGEITEQRRQEVADELGDVFWYAARVADRVGITLDDALAANIAKVNRRLANGTLSGSGGDR